jgi:biotin transport system substrate-specific component
MVEMINYSMEVSEMETKTDKIITDKERALAMGRTRTLTYIALATAIICVLGPLSLSIPISPVPISLTIFAIYIAVYSLNMKWAIVSTLLYIFTGLVGLPVFSGFSGGPGKLFGPTGGYIFGYIFVALFTGLFVDKWESKKYMHIIGMVIGVAICYMFGTIWLARVAGMGFNAALAAGVIPFIPADIVKMILAVIAGPALRKTLRRI